MRNAGEAAPVSPIVPNSQASEVRLCSLSTAHAESSIPQHQLLWACAPQGIFIIRALHGDIVFDKANPAYRSLVGVGEIDLSGKQPSDFLPPDMAQALAKQCGECVATGRAIHYEDSAGPSTDRHWRTTLAPLINPASGRAETTIMGQLWDRGPRGDKQDADGHNKLLLERIIDTSPDTIYLFDVPNGLSAFLSNRVREVLGYEREHLQSMHISSLLELVHPEDLLVVRQHMARVRSLADGVVMTVEYRFRTRDKGYRWFRGKETVFSRAKDGSVEKLVGVLSDIDQLKKARIAFTDMNAKLKAILASISDCYLTIDRECRITNVNAAATKWLGVKADDLVGKPYGELFPGSPAHPVVKKAHREQRAVHVEQQSGLHPGRWIDLRVYPSEGGVNVFFSDITKRKRAEQAAARSKALLNASIDALSAHIVILDADGAVVASNKAWQRFVADQRHETMAFGLGSSFIALYERIGSGSVSVPIIVARLKTLLAGRRSAVRHVYQLGDDGRWYQLVAARFMHHGAAFAVVAMEDVTDVREANRALGELSERMLTLQDDERQRIALELHDSTAQHLAAIGLNVMNLKARGASDADTQRLWDDVEVSLEEATRELRAFTYLLHPMQLELDGLDATLRRYAEGFAQRTGLPVTVSIKGDIDALSVERQRTILRIVQEALANVHRHASASRVLIKQRFAGSGLHLIIRDDGIGMKGTTAQTGKGATPLGVGIQGMRERLRQLGGRLEIKSGPAGTEVHASIPLRQDLHGSAYA